MLKEESQNLIIENQLQCSLIRNSLNEKEQDIQIMKDLIRLKCLYSIQLPRMPKEYLIKLLFDTYHESLIIKKQKKIIAGLTFRGFKGQSFLQIAFLGVINLSQCTGLGSKLMNKLKTICQQRRIQRIFTYADEGAIGFFQKQGFNKNMTLPKKDYKKFIKEYIGGVIMQCKVYNNINYETLNQQLQKMQKFIVQEFKSLTISETGYDLKKCAKLVQQKMKTQKSDITKFIPGLKQAGYVQQDQQKKLTFAFLNYCQNFIELVYKKKHLLEQENQQDIRTKEKSFKIQCNYAKKFGELLKKMEIMLISGKFLFKDDFIQKFTNGLQKILPKEAQRTSKQKQFISKINLIKYDFMRNLQTCPIRQKKSAKKVQQNVNAECK